MNKYELATTLAIAGLDINENMKLSAARQKALFGFAAVGRKDVRFNSDGQGTVTVGRTVNTDYNSRSYTYEEFAQAINDRQQVEAW